MTTDTKIAEELRGVSRTMLQMHEAGIPYTLTPDGLRKLSTGLDRAADRVEADAKEITRLRALVESAYRDAELLRSALQGIIDTDNHLHEGGEETRLFRADEQAARNALAGIGDYKGAHRDTCVKALAEFVEFHARGLAVPNRLWKQAADALGRLERAT